MWAETTAFLMTAAAALYVSRPLFSRTLSEAPVAVDEPLEDRKLQIYEALRDLEYDRQMQKISADEYEQLRAQLTGDAVTLLQGLAERRPSRPPDPLEEEIALYRSRRT